MQGPPPPPLIEILLGILLGKLSRNSGRTPLILEIFIAIFNFHREIIPQNNNEIQNDKFSFRISKNRSALQNIFFFRDRQVT